MSNHDLTIANGPGLTVRQDLEAALQALGTTFQGTAVPLITYPCHVGGSLGVTGNTSFLNCVVTGPAGTSRQVLGQTAASARWQIMLGNSTPESGGSAGSDFVINAYSDAGGLLGQAMSIIRSTRAVSFAGPSVAMQSVSVASNLDVNGQLTGASASFTGQILSTANFGHAITTPAGIAAQYQSSVTSARTWTWGCAIDGHFTIGDSSAGLERIGISTSGAVSMPGFLTCGSGAPGAQLNVRGAVGTFRILQFQTDSVNRWQLVCGTQAESGANAGSDFNMQASNDAGAFLGGVFSVKRSSQVCTFTQQIIGTIAPPSDRVLKENIEPLQDSLAKVMALQGVSFNLRSGPNKRPQIGLIAQDVLPIVPEVVATYEPVPNPMAPEDEALPVPVGETLMALNYSMLIPLLIEAVKELTDRVGALEAAAKA